MSVIIITLTHNIIIFRGPDLILCLDRGSLMADLECSYDVRTGLGFSCSSYANTANTYANTELGIIVRPGGSVARCIIIIIIIIISMV